ncbi:heavy metal-binding domain-containing protein [Niveispirillum sp. KHB5.9]|uniref:heavy metal-binding domain-containing protein n=1 Tax=Niveispirillum sp. KHB5.9 TaxID=3400269 RepID=UPI003A88EADC
MNDELPDLPPGMEWLEYWLNFDWEIFGWGGWIAGILGAALANGTLIILGAWIERRHDRRLTEMEAATACVRVFNGKPPKGVTGRPQMVQACVVMAPAPLGRLAVLYRRIVGGRIPTRQRDMQRTRRLALMRLRQQAQAAGAGVLAGVEFCQIGLDRGRLALIATGTALVGSEPGAAPLVAEAVGAEPPRHWRELAITLGVLVALAGSAAVTDYLFDKYAGQYWHEYKVRHLERKAPPPAATPEP